MKGRFDSIVTGPGLTVPLFIDNPGSILCLFPHSVWGTTRSYSDGVMLVSKINSRELGIRGDEYDEYKKMLQKKFFEMGQEYGCLLPRSITFSFRNGKDVCS